MAPVAVEESSQPLYTRASGELFMYDEEFGFAAFEVGGRGSGHQALVCIGGLTDGLLSLRYLPELSAGVGVWRVVQPVLSSSYRGWGLGSLDEDAADVDKLLAFLSEHRGITEVVLLGHSTGCQDVVRYLAVGRHVQMVRAAILQAPVSDREALQATAGAAGAADVARYREVAAAMIRDGRGQEVMPREACLLLGPPHAVTAYRFDSLTGRMTDDDMFSSDLTDAELREKLGHVSVPTLIAVSLDDEYVPSSVDAVALAKRMASAMAAGPLGLAEPLPIASGGHALRPAPARATFVAAVADFIVRAGRSRARVTWEADVAKELRSRSAGMPAGRPFMVALAGMPGSGKSTAAAVLARLIGPSCIVVPMDGFHLPLAALRARPDAADAVYRRGAPDTFDPAALASRLAAIRGDGPGGAPQEVSLPGFDHAVGDPVQGAVTFNRDLHCVVIVEGLYLLHIGDGWDAISGFFDHRIYVEADVDECIAQLKERNKCIPGYTPEEIEARCDCVDRKNALTVHASAGRADAVVASGAASPTARR